MKVSCPTGVSSMICDRKRLVRGILFGLVVLLVLLAFNSRCLTGFQLLVNQQKTQPTTRKGEITGKDSWVPDGGERRRSGGGFGYILVSLTR